MCNRLKEKGAIHPLLEINLVIKNIKIFCHTIIKTVCNNNIVNTKVCGNIYYPQKNKQREMIL